MGITHSLVQTAPPQGKGYNMQASETPVGHYTDAHIVKVHYDDALSNQFWATVHRFDLLQGSTGRDRFWILEWNDGVTGEWLEHFDDENAAMARLGQLVSTVARDLHLDQTKPPKLTKPARPVMAWRAEYNAWFDASTDANGDPIGRLEDFDEKRADYAHALVDLIAP